MRPLPVDALLPEIRQRVRAERALVLVAEPGAGKTTRVPPALLDVVEGEVLVLEPRRLAARLAARRVAQERGERLGETVGYQVRFESVGGPLTRLRYLTEGVLTRRLLADPELRGVGAVVLDELHERHLQGDLALALVQRLRRGPRPDLVAVAMSATMDAAPVAAFLAAPVVRAPGRPYPVTVEHLDRPDDRPLEKQVASAVRRLASEGLDGDVLVFLPGAAEIRRAREACREFAERRELDLCALHGDLPPEEQDRAVEPGRRRKIVLSTNVAESSVTLPGVVAVVDSGLARVPAHSPWSGLPTLRVARVSRASCEQRAGRAGRVRPGRCLRLFTRHDFESRPEHEAPEVERLDLSEAALLLHGLGVADLGAFEWFEAPPPAALAAAEELLRALGAVDRNGRLTALGGRMLRYPVHPRQARVLIEAQARGRGEEGALLAALLGEREVRRDVRGGLGDAPRVAQVSGPSDLLESLDALRELRRGPVQGDAAKSRLEAARDPDRVRPGAFGARHAIDEGAARAVEQAARALARLAREDGARESSGAPERAPTFLSRGSSPPPSASAYRAGPTPTGPTPLGGTPDPLDPSRAESRPPDHRHPSRLEPRAPGRPDPSRLEPHPPDRRDLSPRAPGAPANVPGGLHPDDVPLLCAILAGYPDRVARRRAPGSTELLLAGGGAAVLAEQSVVRDAEWLVALDAEDRGASGTAGGAGRSRGRGQPGSAGTSSVIVRQASAIAPEWLLDLFPEAIAERDETQWDEDAGRAYRVSRLTYGALILAEDRGPPDPATASVLLARAARALGPEAFADPEELAQLFARARFARAHAPEAGVPALGPADAAAALEALCEGKESLAELRAASLLDALRARLGNAALAALDRLAPERLALLGGRTVRVHYEEGKPPWIESRLQDFFGMREGPRVAQGRVPVVLHLLAPNQRAVQVTTDLAGFWERHYPAIRRELGRKYPRHAWPEDPRTASPSAARGR